MKKQQIWAWLWLGFAGLALLYSGVIYRIGGFTPAYALTLAMAAVAVPMLVLGGFRRIGTFPAWLFLAGYFVLLWYSMQDIATALLAWALCCGTPLAVTFFWPSFKAIKPMTYYALPFSGLLWMGGVLGYCKLHFGSWSPAMMVQRIGECYQELGAQLEQIYQQVYEGAVPEQLQQMLEQFNALAPQMGFTTVMLVVYGLFGIFFLSLWLADRMVPADGRWLGSWQPLIPGRGISWLYMISYLPAMFFSGSQWATFLAVYNLFGFFFVFTALYRLRQLFRRKGMNPFLQVLLIGLLFVASYLTVGGALLAPYNILMFLGWWIATAPRFPIQKNDKGDEDR